jgi:hypothetical protein
LNSFGTQKRCAEDALVFERAAFAQYLTFTPSFRPDSLPLRMISITWQLRQELRPLLGSGKCPAPRNA